MKINQILVIVIACLFSALAAVGLYNFLDKDKGVTPSNYPAGQFETVSYTEDDIAKTSSMPFDFTKAAKKGLPAVVHVKSYVERQGSSSSRQPSMQDFFDEFFGRRTPNQEREPQRGIGFGSGVVISEDGYIITNNHVIADANEIEVSFYDDEIVTAELIGTDPTTDIALIKVDRVNLPHLQFANSNQLEVGEWVAAIGNPAVGPDAFALKSTVTAGIVSAKGRNIRINREIDLAIESFIQTDAVINRGNSGGALVNTNGDLVGINTAISTPTGVYAGYGFAVPSNLARKVVSDLKEYGEVQRALLGIQFSDISDLRNKGLEVDSKEKEGLLIASVVPDGAADKAGLKQGDVIIALDGEDVTDQKDKNLQEIIGTKRPGESLQVTYRRNGSTKSTTVKLMSAEATKKNTELAMEKRFIEDLGVGVEPLNGEELSKFNVEGGVKVTEVNRNSLLYRASYGDVGQGFVITHVNQNPVNSAEDVRRAIKQTSQNMVKIDGFDESNSNNRYSYSFPLK